MFSKIDTQSEFVFDTYILQKKMALIMFYKRKFCSVLKDRISSNCGECTGDWLNFSGELPVIAIFKIS